MYCENSKIIFMLTGKRIKIWKFFYTRSAVSCPQIDDDDLSLVLSKMERMSVCTLYSKISKLIADFEADSFFSSCVSSCFCS